MFCESCGAKLKDGAKFCGGCGTKVSSAPINDVVTSINLTPLSAGWGNCGLKITSVSAEGPDSDGDFRNIEINYEISNQMEVDWDHLSVRVQLLSAAGQVVEESRDVFEQTICAGETEALQATMYSLKARKLGASPEKAHVIINVVGSCLLQQSLGEISIPAIAYEPVALKPVKLGGAVQMIAGSLWRTEPGDDKEAQIEVKALIQNLTNMHLSEVKLIASVTDKSGRELTDAGGYDEVRPANICVISGSGWVKDKKLVGAIAGLSIRAFVPIAAGIEQHCGIQITPEAPTDEDNEFVHCELPSFDKTVDETEDETDNGFKNGQKLLDALEEKTGLNDGWESAVEWDLVEYDEDESILVRDVHLTAKGCRDIWKIVVNINFNSRSGKSFDDENLEISVLYVFFKWKDKEGTWRDDDGNDSDGENTVKDDALRSFRGWVEKTFSAELLAIDAQISSNVNSSSPKRNLYANMKWFSPADQPSEISHLPVEFFAAKKLWDSNKNENLDAIIGLLSKYVSARFIPSNISNWEELFAYSKDDGIADTGFTEVESEDVKLVGIDFELSPIPLCKAEATFRVDVTDEFSSTDLNEWQESNGPFTDGVVFYWRIPETPPLEGLDFTAGDNSGVECIVLDDTCSEDSMALQDLLANLASDFKADPRNKIFVTEEMLVASATEETGTKVSAARLRKVIAAYLSGDMDDEFQAIYDGAVYACGLAARHCFNDDPDDDIDYEVGWQEQEDGSYIAEVRPS
jgi:hypothetical protein